MPGLGRYNLAAQIGNGLQALFNLDRANWKPIGGTIAWATVAAVASTDVTLKDENVVVVGQKALRYGQILCEITTGTVQTVTLTGSPGGGTFTLTAVVNGVSVTSGAIAYGASATTLQTALAAMSNIGAGNVSVAGSAGGPWTVTFLADLAALVIPALGHNNAGLTGGTSPNVTTAVVNTGQTTTGDYGPYDASATDGRQTLTRGACFILNQTVLQNGVLPGWGGAGDTDHPPGLFDGGTVWKARIIMGTQTNELGGPAGPSVSAFEAAFPRISYAR